MTKQVSFLLVTLCFLSVSLSAQSDAKWSIKRFGATIGVDQDMLSTVDHGYFTSLLDAETQAKYAGIDYEEQYKYAGICENPHVQLTMSLVNPKWRNTEVNLAMNIIASRNDGVSYYNYDNKLGETNYLSFDNWGHEINVGGSIVKSATLLNTFRFFGGVGTNLGYTFGNYLSINASDYRNVLDYSLLETGQIVTPGQDYATYQEDYYYYSDHRIRDGISQRVFAHAGASIIILRKLELGLEGRLGYGYRYHVGRSITGARLQSIGLTGKWILGKNEKGSRLF